MTEKIEKYEAETIEPLILTIRGQLRGANQKKTSSLGKGFPKEYL